MPLVSTMAAELENTKAELEAVRQQLSAVLMERDELRDLCATSDYKAEREALKDRPDRTVRGGGSGGGGKQRG